MLLNVSYDQPTPAVRPRQPSQDERPQGRTGRRRLGKGAVDGHRTRFSRASVDSPLKYTPSALEEKNDPAIIDCVSQKDGNTMEDCVLSTSSIASEGAQSPETLTRTAPTVTQETLKFSPHSISSFQELHLNPMLTASLASKFSIFKPSLCHAYGLNALIPAELKASKAWCATTSIHDFQRHLKQGLDKASGRHDYILTASADSYNCLAYILPIVNNLLAMHNPPVVSSGVDYFKSSAAPLTSQGPSIATKSLDRSLGTFAIIITPTRDSAVAMTELLTKLLSFPKIENLDADVRAQLQENNLAVPRWIVPGNLLCGINRSKEKSRLRQGTTILVSTLGRLIDHLEMTSSWAMKHLAWVVLDDADKFMEAEKIPVFQKLWQLLAKRFFVPEEQAFSKRQWSFIMLSETITKAPSEMSSLKLFDPLLMKVERRRGTKEAAEDSDDDVIQLENVQKSDLKDFDFTKAATKELSHSLSEFSSGDVSNLKYYKRHKPSF